MTNPPPASWLTSAKLKAKRFRTEAHTASGGIAACQEEISALTAELRRLTSRRDGLLKHRAALTQINAKPGDSRLENVDAQLAPLHTEIAAVEAGMVDTKTRQAEVQQAAAPLFRLSNACELVIPMVQGQPHQSAFTAVGA